MSRLTQGFKASCRIRGYHPLWPAFPNRSAIKLQTTGLVRVRSPLLAESLLMSFPPATEMFQFAGFASWTYVFSPRSVRRLGLPHSDIRESTNARFSSRLFAACHVLHRLSVPRHPPNALITLDLSPLTVLTARRDKPCHANDKPRRHFPFERYKVLPSPMARRRQNPRSLDGDPRFTHIHNIKQQISDLFGSYPIGIASDRTLAFPDLFPNHTTSLVEVNGIEPMTSCLQSTRSTN